MKNEDLELMLKELDDKVRHGDVYYADSIVKGLFNSLIRGSLKLFPDKNVKLLEMKKSVMEKNHGPYGSDILIVVKEIRRFLDAKIEKDLRDKKTFLRDTDLIENARKSLQKGEDAYSINLCDSAVEAFLKEVFDIPSTIVGAGSVKFLSECMILDIPKGLNLYLGEVKNKVCQMNNQVKHKSYVPSRLDAINSLKAAEEFFVRKNRFLDLTDEEKRKVQTGIGLIKK